MLKSTASLFSRMKMGTCILMKLRWVICSNFFVHLCAVISPHNHLFGLRTVASFRSSLLSPSQYTVASVRKGTRYSAYWAVRWITLMHDTVKWTGKRPNKQSTSPLTVTKGGFLDPSEVDILASLKLTNLGVGW